MSESASQLFLSNLDPNAALVQSQSHDRSGEAGRSRYVIVTGVSMCCTAYLFDAAAVTLGLLNMLLLSTLLWGSIRLWPPPGERSWQDYTFWLLFRGGLGLMLLHVAVTARWPSHGEELRFALGLIGVVIGFGITIYGYFDLGLERTYGANGGLVTNGLYRYSRNPQCVASIVGFSGIALAHGGVQVAILCGLAILVFILMPFAEEPWLRQAYGDAYEAYARRVPRFL